MSEIFETFVLGAGRRGIVVYVLELVRTLNCLEVIALK